MHETTLEFEVLDYVPVYRTEAGTGGGWGFGCWRP
jgi:3-O-methylgallate 3,4-dioxygenase